MCPDVLEKIILKVVLRRAAALNYQVANGYNNDENGYDGHPVKSHRRECSSDRLIELFSNALS